MRQRCQAVTTLCVFVAALSLLRPLPARAAGQVLVFYQVTHAAGGTPNPDVMVQRVSTAGEVGWAEGSQPRPVAATPLAETSPVSCSDSRSGAYVAYLAAPAGAAEPTPTQLFVQRVDGQGKTLWEGAGTNVAPADTRQADPQIVPDGQGGALVVFTCTGADGDSDVLAQHLSPDGKRLWLWDNDRLSYAANSARPERHPQAVPTREGGVIVVFEWEAPNGSTDLMAQCLGPDGLPRWNEGKQAVDVAASSESEGQVAAVSDGQGGALLAYTVTRDRRDNPPMVDLLAQRLTADGKLAWQNGAGVQVASYLPQQSPLAMTEATATQGSLTVAYWLPPTANADNPRTQIVAQRLSPDGQPLWNGGREPVVISAVKNRVVSLAGAAAGSRVVIVFGVELMTEDHHGDVLLAAQCLNRDGAGQWAEGRYVRLSRAYQRELNPRVVEDGDNGVVVLFERQASNAPATANTDLLANRLSPQGTVLWSTTEDCVTVADDDDRETDASVVVSGF